MPLPATPSIAEYRALRADPTRWRDAIAAIGARHGLDASAPRPLGGSNLVAAIGGARVVKLFPPLLRPQYEAERVALSMLAGRLAIATPALVHDGALDGWPYLVMTALDGRSLGDVWPALAELERVDLLAQIGALIASVQAIAPAPIAALDRPWAQRLDEQLAGCAARHAARGLPAALLADLGPYLDRVAPALPRDVAPVLLTGEYTPENLLVAQGGDRWQLTGLVDFGDVTTGPAEYDLLGPSTFLACGRPQRVRALFAGRGDPDAALTPALRDRLMALLLLHRHSDLSLQIRIDHWPARAATFDQLAALLWPFAPARAGAPPP